MSGLTKRQERLFHRAEQMINNAQANPEVAAAMAVYGYDAERWASGQALLDAALAGVQANEAAFATQLGATDTFNASYDKAWDQAQTLARLCAALFAGDTERISLLGLHKRRNGSNGASQIAWPRRSRRLSAFLPWARNLYGVAQAQAQIAAILAEYGYPAERLSGEAAEVEAVAQADSAQEIAKAKRQQSTLDRDQAVKELKGWLRRTEKIARIAMRQKRQLLELTGLRV